MQVVQKFGDVEWASLSGVVTSRLKKTFLTAADFTIRHRWSRDFSDQFRQLFELFLQKIPSNRRIQVTEIPRSEFITSEDHIEKMAEEKKDDNDHKTIQERTF